MKKQFEQPIIKVITITSEDVIKTSGGFFDPNGDLTKGGDTWPW